MALVTQESVYAAAEEITGRSGKVTLASVRDALGGGSPNAVLVHLRAWRSLRAAMLSLDDVDLDLVDEPIHEPIPLPALPEVTAAVEAVGQAVTAAVTRIQGDERRAGEARLHALAGSHAEALALKDRMHIEAVAALKLRVADAEADLDGAAPAIAEVETLRVQVADLEVEGAKLRADIAIAASEYHAVSVLLTEAIDARTATSAAADRAIAEASEWKAQLALSQTELVSVRAELAAAAVAASTALEALRGEMTAALAAARAELSEAVASVRLADQRLADARGGEERERAAREKAEERAAALVERASRAEAELALATRQSPVPQATA